MIKAEDAVRTARSLLGTPYAEMDCINLIKAVIRRSPGGVPKYRTAGTASLWASGDASGTYRDLTERRLSILNPRAGMLAFKGLPRGYGGEPHHVGLVTGAGTVVHSSSAKGKVVETPLDSREGWTLLAVHRYIDTSSVSCADSFPRGEARKENDMTYKALVSTEEGGLNLRTGPSAKEKRIAVIPKGETVDVLAEANEEWAYVKYGKRSGYANRSYLQRIEEEPDESPEQWCVCIPCGSEAQASEWMHMLASAYICLRGND